MSLKRNCPICGNDALADLSVFINGIGTVFLCRRCILDLPGAITKALAECADIENVE
jgi:hypothetical protein